MQTEHVVASCNGYEERLSLAGKTVLKAKKLLRESLSIPFFADGLVNGRRTYVDHVLRPGDRLAFRKRYGIKGGDKPPDKLEADALLQRYPELVKIGERVKRMKVSKDKGVDLMTGMVIQWCEKHFGPPTSPEKQVLQEVVELLKHIQPDMERRRSDMLNDTEKLILETLGNEELKGEAIARRAGCNFNSHFKNTLASMVKQGLLGNNQNGYYVEKGSQAGLGQD